MTRNTKPWMGWGGTEQTVRHRAHMMGATATAMQVLR